MTGYTRLSPTLMMANGKVFFECPACDAPHGLNIMDASYPKWDWNGDAAKPTFSPSVLVTFPYWRNEVETNNVCHSFVRDGQIQYLSDCTHEMAGTTIDIPVWNTEPLKDGTL